MRAGEVEEGSDVRDVSKRVTAEEAEGVGTVGDTVGVKGISRLEATV